jgi:hypothetical protein
MAVLIKLSGLFALFLAAIAVAHVPSRRSIPFGR